MILALTALSTAFIGLLAILLLYGYRRNGGSSRQHAHNDTLQQWLTHHNVSLPSASAVLSTINRKASKEGLQPTVEGENLSMRGLRVEQLLPGTPPPVFTVLNLSLLNTDTMSVECVVEWPGCVPGVLVREKEGRRSHRLQVKCMKMKAAVELSVVDGQLEVSWQLLQRPQLELSCAAAEDEEEVTDSMSTIIAATLSTLLTQLSITKQLLTDNTEEEQEEEEEEEEEETTSVGTAGRGEERTMEKDVVDGEEQTLLDKEEEEEEKENWERHDDGVMKKEEKMEQTGIVENENEEQEADSDCLTNGKNNILVPVKIIATPSSLSNGTLCDGTSSHCLPTSLLLHDSSNLSNNSWRRTPSYECLEQIAMGASPENMETIPLSRSQENLLDDYSERERMSTMSIRSYESILEDTIGTIPSTLVFEIHDGRHVQHRVAPDVKQARLLRKQYPRSKKLHLYLEHTFTAVHMRGRQHCIVCRDKITGYIGKQAYQCRDCNTLAHKQCHYKVEATCTHSRVSSMNLLYPAEGDYFSSSPKL